jgi:hypothetical protein
MNCLGDIHRIVYKHVDTEEVVGELLYDLSMIMISALEIQNPSFTPKNVENSNKMNELPKGEKSQRSSV